MRRVLLIGGAVGAALGLFLVVSYVLIEAQVQTLPDTRPERCAELDRTKPVYVALGDSLTHGTVSANYVERLTERFGGQLTVVNGGVNSETAYSVRRRLDAVVACAPDIVTVLLGTNDVNATLSAEKSARYVKLWGLPAPPSEEQFVDGITHVLDRLTQETDARVALVAPPLIGEVPSDPVNQTLRRYIERAFDLARERDVSTLNVLDAQAEAIQNDSEVEPASSERCTAGDYPIEIAVAQRTLLGRDWNRIAESFGFRYTTDCLHLTERSADIVARIVGDWLASNIP